MFHFDITLETTRLIVSDAHKIAARKLEIFAHKNGDHDFRAAESADLRGQLMDLNSGMSIDIEISHNDLAAVCALAIHNDGEPGGEQATERFYNQLEPWLEKYKLRLENTHFCPIP